MNTKLTKGDLIKVPHSPDQPVPIIGIEACVALNPADPSASSIVILDAIDVAGINRMNHHLRTDKKVVFRVIVESSTAHRIQYSTPTMCYNMEDLLPLNPSDNKQL